MNLPQPSQQSGGATRLSGIARLVRRICVLREQGEAAAAARLEEIEYATAVRDTRLSEGPEALPAAELQTIWSNEERRVADAVVLAELLAPRLNAAIANVGLSQSRVTASRPVPAEREPQVTISRIAEPLAGSPAITDLLDAMLAADRATRSVSSGRRDDH